MELELLCLCTWKLTSDLSTRQTFLKRLHRSYLFTLGNQQLISVRESGPDSSTGVLEKILLYVRSLFSSYAEQFFLYLGKEFRLLVPAIKCHETVINPFSAKFIFGRKRKKKKKIAI